MGEFEIQPLKIIACCIFDVGENTTLDSGGGGRNSLLCAKSPPKAIALSAPSTSPFTKYGTDFDPGNVVDGLSTHSLFSLHF